MESNIGSIAVPPSVIHGSTFPCGEIYRLVFTAPHAEALSAPATPLNFLNGIIMTFFSLSNSRKPQN